MRRSRVAAALLAAALACGLAGSASGRTSAPAKYGGPLVVGLAGDPDTLDPTTQHTIQSFEVLKTICEPLYRVAPNHGAFQLYPVLAAALPVLSKDKLSLTVQLRQGVKFNDGTAFNASAVVTTIQRNQTPASTVRSLHLDSVPVTATGPYTVIFHLNQRDSTYIPTAMIMSPAQLNKLGDNFGSSPVCVGPFMFDNRVVGDHITVIKSPYYYDSNDVYLDKIVFKPISPGAAAAALQAGDVQVLDRVATTDVPALQQNTSLRVIKAIGAGWSGVEINIGNKNGLFTAPVNVGTPLASSPLLRQAFEEAIDRTTLARVVYGGLLPPSCTPVPRTDGGWFDASIACTPYDPADARKLVARSGFANPTVHVLTIDGDALRLAQFVQAAEAAVGINVVIDVVDTATRNARAASGNFDVFVIMGCCPASGDPDGILNSRFHTLGASNRTGYSNKRFDLLIDNGVKATNLAVRKKLYDLAQEIIVNDRPLITFSAPVTFAACRADVGGVSVNPGGLSIDVAFAQFR